MKRVIMIKNVKILILISLTIFMFNSACKKTSGKSKNQSQGNKSMPIEKQLFGTTPQGEDVFIYTLTNQNDLQVRIITYGAIVVSLEVPDRDGNIDDIVLGYDDLNGYINNNPYFGAIVGRYGNRINKGIFKLSGKQYLLAKNNGENHLHGGIKGFDKVVWKGESIEQKDAAGVALSYLSPDGEEGYPGNLTCQVTYFLTNNNELIVDYKATTDKITILNLTHHSYFNLTGQGKGDILNHQLQIKANYFTPVDQGLITTGDLQPVKDTPFDFRESTAIGERIDLKHPQLQYGGGYDHNWVLTNQNGSLALAAKVIEPSSGRVMEIHTTEPGIQFYSGNFLDGTIKGKNKVVYYHRTGFCLETQHYPDSPNKPDFPSVVLKPGQTYTQKTVHRFNTQ